MQPVQLPVGRRKTGVGGSAGAPDGQEQFAQHVHGHPVQLRAYVFRQIRPFSWTVFRICPPLGVQRALHHFAGLYLVPEETNTDSGIQSDRLGDVGHLVENSLLPYRIVDRLTGGELRRGDPVREE